MNGVDGYEDDETDGLVQSTFTIPCASSSKINQTFRGGFPVLTKYEQTAGPSKLRQKGYESARKQAVRAFENTLSSIYDPVIEEIESYCVKCQSRKLDFFIPGSSAGKATQRLPAACLIGPQVSHCFYDRLKERIQRRKSFKWVALQPRECVSLAATVRLVVANLINESASVDINASGLSSLGTLSSSTTAVIYLRSVALHKYNILNDFIKALHSVAQASNCPRLVVLLGVEAGIGSLDDKVDSESMRLMDMHRISMPSPSIAFDTIMKELYLSSEVDTSIWLGPSVLDLLRYQYYERGFDLDKVLATVKLALHHHFTTRPLSAIAALSSTIFDSSDWTQVFFDRLRLHIVEADGQGMINLPRPASKNDRSKQEYLQSLLTDDDALLLSMSDFNLASSHYRRNTQRAIHLLHTLRSHLLIQANKDETNEPFLEPSRSRLGGLAWHILSGQGTNKLISSIVGALRKASMRQLKEALGEVLSNDWSVGDEESQLKLTSFMAETEVELEREKEEEADMEVDHDDEKRRLEMVQRRLLREESSDAVRRKVSDGIRIFLDDWIKARPILAQVYTYDFTSYLTQICDPSPRGSILAALNDPTLSLDTKTEEDRSNIPDICRLYQVYQSAGKMINLFDLYQAFSQSIQGGHRNESLSSKKRKLNGNAVDQMLKRDAVQARFALAINEMGKMGFMKKTRRKPDHVLKIVHDLASSANI